ncbi:MAG: hypothetical protein EU539_01745 [Promethearchaeota archaeon]|nr:MAG: hypothetical protein EU539_01745 [Candidatus Lokiarchaeota archaeon]
MVSIQDIEKLIDEYMLDKDIEFGKLKPYILNEFEWDVDRMKKLEFLIRGKVVPDDLKFSELLNMYLPMETLVVQEV